MLVEVDQWSFTFGSWLALLLLGCEGSVVGILRDSLGVEIRVRVRYAPTGGCLVEVGGSRVRAHGVAVMFGPRRDGKGVRNVGVVAMVTDSSMVFGNSSRW